MQKTYTLKILKKNEIAENTLELEIEKPEYLAYVAGQYLLILIPGHPEIPPYSFSLASAPHEKNLKITMRYSDSPFKQEIRRAQAGFLLHARGPFGTLKLHKNTDIPAVCIAGGIGITPFRSIIADEAEHGFSHSIFLFYCNKKISSAGYYDELTKIQNPKFHQIHVVEKFPKDWKGEKGLIGSEIIKKYISDIHVPIFYIVGPPIMVDIVKKLLLDMGVPADHITLERFTGYKK